MRRATPEAVGRFAQPDWTISVETALPDVSARALCNASNGRGPGRRRRTLARCGAVAVALLGAAWAPAVAHGGDVTDAADIADQVTDAATGTGISIDGGPTSVDVSASVDVAVSASVSTPDVGETAAETSQPTPPTAVSAGGATVDATRTLADAAPTAPDVTDTTTDAADVVDAVTTASLDTPPSAVSARGPTAASRRRVAVRTRQRAVVRTEASSAGGTATSSARVVVSSATRLSAEIRSIRTRAAGTPSRSHGGASQRSPSPRAPERAPPLPLAPQTTPSIGGGSGAGTLLPPLVAAIAGLIGVFGAHIFVRRVAAPRSRPPRRLSLPPWRPG